MKTSPARFQPRAGNRPCRARPADRSLVAEDRSAGGVRDQTGPGRAQPGRGLPARDRPAAPGSADRQVAGQVDDPLGRRIVIIDKNARIGDGARLVNAAGVDHADGDGYYIRGGIIVVPKGGIIREGTIV